MADASIKFDTKFDSKAFERGIRDVEKKLADMNKTAGRLGGSFSSLDNKGSKSFSSLNKSIDTSVVKFNGFGRAVGAAMTAVTALIGALAAGGLAKNFLQTAARTETLGVAMESVARANGVAIETMNEHKKAVMDMGIAEQEATQIMTRFMQAQLDTADAAKLARVAQDAAVIANLDSSEAAERMTEAIAKQSPELLDVFGMTRNLNDIYADYSATIGKTSQQLSEFEKRQAIMNYIFSEGEKITGTYEASMGTAGKQIGSLSRHWQTFQNTLATPFLPALAKAVEGVTNALVGATAWLENNRATLEAWGQTLADVIGFFFKIEKKAVNSSKKTAAAVVTPKEVSNQTQPIEDQTKAIDNQGKAIENNAKKAKKASKQLQAFDQLNRMQSEDDGSSSGSGSGSGAGAGAGASSGIKPSDYSMDPRELGADKLEDTLGRMTDKLMKFAEEWGLIDFYEKIKEGFEMVDWDNMRNNLDRISEGWSNIGSAAGEAIKGIVKAAFGMAGTVYKYMIAIVGEIIDIWIEGFADFTEEMEEEIIEWIGNVGDKLREGIENMTAIYEIIGEVFLKTLRKYRPRMTKAVKNTFKNVTEAFMLVGTIISDVYNQITERVLKFLEDNEEDVQLFVDNIAEIFLDLWDGINKIWEDGIGALKNFWDNHGQEMLGTILGMFEDLAALTIKQFNEVIKPAWDDFVEKFAQVWEENIEPMIEPALELVAKLINLIGIIWNDFVYPAIVMIQEHLAPAFSWAFGFIGDIVANAIRNMTDFIGGLITFLGGLIDFITGVLTGDWELAWSGLVDIGKGAMESLAVFIRDPVNAIIDTINGMIEGIVGAMNGLGGILGNMSFDIPDWVPGGLGGKHFDLSLPKMTAPKIPHLAKGGLIPPRKPRPVIVGDNMVEDEIVSPVSTMQKAMADVLASHGGASNQELVQLMREIRDLLSEGAEVTLDERPLGRFVQKAIRDNRKQTGISLT